MMIDFNLVPILPELFLAIIAMGLLIVGVFRGNSAAEIISWYIVIALAFSALILLRVGWNDAIVLNGMFKLDPFIGFMKLLVIFGLMAAISLSIRYLQQEQIMRFEYPVLVLFAGIGMMLMLSANHLLSLYVALELQSLSLYVLAAIQRNSRRSSEAGAKYFILGALSSGMILFGISLIYGFTGTLDFQSIRAVLQPLETLPTGVLFGLVFILAGLAFKISAVPFHMWTPDVYQGAPTSVTALFAMVPKLAAMGLLIRILFEPFASAGQEWMQIIYFLSLSSMIVGAFAALVQENIKRLMAYSSIGNMGYALIGVAAGTPEGVSSVIVYMLIYMVMTAGAFAIIMCMRRGGLPCEKISDLSGASANHPGLAYAMAVLMFSMSGIPPLAGFFGKLLVFHAAVDAQLYILAVLGVLTSVVAAYYYLRIIKVMFFDAAADAFDRDTSFSRNGVLAIAVIFVIAFAFKPSWLVSASQSVAATLFTG